MDYGIVHFKDKGNSKKQFTYSELFKRECPRYMSMGMTYKEYWEGDNDLPIFYRKKHEYDLQHMNEMAYLQGVYVAKAISACFSNGEFKYPDKPDLLNLSINKEIIAEEERLQAEQYTKQLREYMQMLGNNSLKAKEKK